MSPVKQVLMTVDPLGGVWTYAMELARGLAQQDVVVTFASMGTALSARQRAEAATIPGATVFESKFQLEWMNDPWRDVERAGDWLLALEKDLQPDVIHLNGYVHASLPWRAPVLVVAHSDVLSWWEAVEGTTAPEEWNEYRDRVKQGLLAADAITTVSHAIGRALTRCYGPLAYRVTYNGRTLHNPSARKEHLVLTCGRFWDEAKNVRALDAAAPAIDWPILAAGDGGSHLHNLRVLGKLGPGEMAAWFARASIFALPARYEPFGYAPLEAALSGCALVLGDIPSLREIWGDAALYARPDDVSGLADAVNSLIRDKALRESFARLALIRAARYRAKHMAEEYLSVYERIAAGALCNS